MAAVADQLGGDSLGDGALGAGVDQQRVVGVAVDVDEAGGNDHARRVEPARRVGVTQVAYRGDPAVLDGYVSGDAGRASAVDYGAAADYEVDHAGVPSGSLRGCGAGGSTWTVSGTALGLLLNRSRGSVEHGFTNYVELPFEASQPRFKFGDALGEMVDTPVNLVEALVNLAETLVNLAETLVNLVETLIGVRLELAETLVESSFHSMQGSQRECCQSNTNGKDADKYGKDAGKLSHSNKEFTIRSKPAISLAGRWRRPRVHRPLRGRRRGPGGVWRGRAPGRGRGRPWRA